MRKRGNEGKAERKQKGTEGGKIGNGKRRTNGARREREGEERGIGKR